MSGRGETFKSGGRVVKNVTGYDLCKLIAGSWGTLAAMTDVTIKTLPRAETEATVLVLKLDDVAASKAMAAATGSFADVSRGGASAGYCRGAHCRDRCAAQSAVTAFRLEGVAPSVVERKTVLEKLLAPFGTLGSLGEAASRALWRAVRDVTPFAAAGPAGSRDLWRISTAPTQGAARPLESLVPMSAGRSRKKPTPSSFTTGPAASSGSLCRPRTTRMRRWCVPQSLPPAAMPR